MAVKRRGTAASEKLRQSLVEALPPNQRLAWRATPKQKEFLSAPEFEVLYGGAAGGGKTDGLLVDALGLGPWTEKKPAHFEKRAYQAIIFRQTFPDLKDIIDRSHEIYPEAHRGAKYDKQAHVWNFPSGARIEFGFIQRDIERFRYRGRAFQYIGWEELTLWPTPAPYIYLIGRVRSSDPTIPLYIRATTNPDGPGFGWVKERWRITKQGRPTKFEVALKDQETGETYLRSRAFIPAKLDDNPHLGVDYRAGLLQLDEEDQQRMLRGIWEAPQIKGAYYGKEMDDARAEGRILRVPYVKSVPVNTFWDLGANDTTAIWCHQYVAMQHRFLKCMEASGEGLSFFVRWLLEHGYTYGVHYLPHDAYHVKLGMHDVKSSAIMLQELMPGHRFEKVNVTPDLMTGIEQTRSKFSECFFDEEGCAEGLAALTHYRKKWDAERQTYLNHHEHDWSSNYADAFRQFGQGWKDTSREAAPRQRAWEPTDMGMGM